MNRAKARWFKRVMYESHATSTQKCFAYIVSDHLNCVTLDAWPAQTTTARLLGNTSIKTVQRVAHRLEAIDILVLRRNTSRRSNCRYAPVFLPRDWDDFDPNAGHGCLQKQDNDVTESFLPIHSKSSSTEEANRQRKGAPFARLPFNRKERGALEMEVAGRLGADGWDILARLGMLDDAIIDRLCCALVRDLLGPPELAAARLAAQQM